MASAPVTSPQIPPLRWVHPPPAGFTRRRPQPGRLRPVLPSSPFMGERPGVRGSYATSRFIIAALITISTALIPTSTARLGQISASPQPFSITSRIALLA